MDLLKYEEVYTNLLEYSISDVFRNELEIAKKQFFIEEDQSDFMGFSEWFIFNYRLSGTDQTIAKKYGMKHQDETVLALSNSIRSIFELKEENDSLYLMDIFSGMHYKINQFALNTEMIHCLRIVEENGIYTIIGDDFEYDALYKDVIKRYVLDQFNHMNTLEQPMRLDTFLDLHNHLLFKLHDVLESIYEDNALEDAFDLHQASYAVKSSRDSIIDRMDQSQVTLYPDEDDSHVFKCLIEDEWIAEIEFVDHMMYVLCNNEGHLNYMINLLSTFSEEHLVFLARNVYSVEELLE